MRVAEGEVLALCRTVGPMGVVGQAFMEVVGGFHLKSAKFSGKTGVGLRSASGTNLRKQ